MARAMDMQDVAGVYISTARSTATRLAKARAEYESGYLDLEEYHALLKVIESEDKLLTSCAKNFEKGNTVQNTPIAVEAVDYEAKLTAIK